RRSARHGPGPAPWSVRGRTVGPETLARGPSIIRWSRAVAALRRDVAMHRRVHRSWLPVVIAALAVLVILPSLAGEADAATNKWQARCTANVRAYPNTSSRILRVVARGAVVP